MRFRFAAIMDSQQTLHVSVLTTAAEIMQEFYIIIIMYSLSFEPRSNGLEGSERGF